MTALKILVAILFATVFAQFQALAQPNLTQREAYPAPSPTPTPASTSRLCIRAIKTSEPIKIDGRLDETSWIQADPANDFLQQRPNEGMSASERTEARVLFDDKNIYFGIRAWDSDAGRINARELVRDASFSNDDKVEILLDTYHDRRNAFRFAVSALVQLNSAARLSVINVRLRYIYRPNSDFFIIYNQSTGAGLERPSYSLQIKLTRDFTF